MIYSEYKGIRNENAQIRKELGLFKDIKVIKKTSQNLTKHKMSSMRNLKVIVVLQMLF